MAEVQLMTQAEYARHRGVSAVAVHKAINKKRISLIGDKIDPVVADIQWEQNTRARVRKAPAPAAAPAPELRLELLALAETQPAPPPTEPPREDDYQKARTRREQSEATMAEMKLREQQGILVNAERVRKEFAEQVTAVRDALLQLPGRLAPQLIGETDQARVQMTLDAEIRNLLTQFAGGKI